MTGRISECSLGAVIRDIRRETGATGLLRAGMYYALGGQYEQQQIAFQGVIAVFAAAVGLVFLLLLILHENLRMTLAILAIPLLAVAAVFVGLWMAEIELNISSMMGMTMNLGIVTELAIFFFSVFRHLVGADRPRCTRR